MGANPGQYFAHLPQGVTELLASPFSVCDRWHLLAVIWFFFGDYSAGTRRIIQQVVRNDLQQQWEYRFRMFPYEFLVF